MQLHGRAEEALQQCIVKFLRDARPFGEPFFKAYVELRGVAVQTQAVKSHHPERAGQHQANAEPPGLPECRIDLESDAGFRAIPKAVGVAGDHAEAIRSGAEVGVVGFAGFHRLAPTGIEAIQPVFKSYAAGDGEAEAGVVEGEPLTARWNPQRILRITLGQITWVKIKRA